MKQFGWVLCGLLLVGCGVNASGVDEDNQGTVSAVKTEVLKKIEVKPNDDEQKVLADLEEYNQGYLDIQIKKNVFTPEGSGRVSIIGLK